jgi:ATP-binding cassette subfamily C (CFTR/MRP) protein 1
VFVRALLVNLSGLSSSRDIHEKMLARVLRSPMSFFDTTPIGRVLNRFTKDINTIDEQLPRTLSMFVSTTLSAINVLIVIGVVTPFFLTAVLPLGFFYRYIQKYYLESSRELKRLESISKSPIYAQFSETLNGLSTIRSYQRQSQFITINNQKLDTNMSAYYALTAANRWLGVRLEFLGTFVITLAAAFAVIERTSLGPGFAGLSISYALQLTSTLNWLVRMVTEAETQMVSVERCLYYTKLETEGDEHTDFPLPSRIFFYFF